ncbi:MAG: hypothetical protein PHR94_15910, partial [Methylomonas lenta]|nr:hypothetical protein [Methylomonas lenta]
MDDKFRSKLQDRMIQREIEENPQPGLIKFMNASIDDFASESPARVNATRITQTMIYVTVQLFCSLYTHASK